MQRLANEHCNVIFSTVLALRFRAKNGSEQRVYKRNEQKSTGCGTFDRTLPLALRVSRDRMKSTQEITQEVRELGQWIPGLRQQIGHVVIGQKYLVDRLLLGLLANGHLLLEGVPGLAKTLTVKTMAACIQTGFQRLQFTPIFCPQI